MLFLNDGAVRESGRVQVWLRPITDPIWLRIDCDGSEVFADGEGCALSPRLLALIARDAPVEVSIVRLGAALAPAGPLARLRLNRHHTFAVGPEHVLRCERLA